MDGSRSFAASKGRAAGLPVIYAKRTDTLSTCGGKDDPWIKGSQGIEEILTHFDTEKVSIDVSPLRPCWIPPI